MFTRWQKRKRKSPAFDDARGTDVQYAAIVVESAHIDDKPAQQQIADSGSIIDSAIAQCAFFWQGAMKQFGQLAKEVGWALRRMARNDSELSTEKYKIPY